MEVYDFKENFANSVFKLMGRILVLTILAQIVVALVSHLFTTLLVPELLGIQQEMQLITQEYQSDPEQMINELKGLFTGDVSFSYLGIAVLVIISLVVGFITYNILYNGVKNEVSSGDNSFGSALSNIFDSRLVKYLAVTIILNIAVILVFILLGFTGSGLLIFLGFLIVVPIMVWMYLSMAAVGLANASVGDALKLSFSTLTIGRWAKTIGIGIVVMICIFIIALIVGLVANLVANIPAVGPVLSLAINALVNGLMVAFLVAGFSGLYYRYTKNESLAEEELIVTD